MLDYRVGAKADTPQAAFGRQAAASPWTGLIARGSLPARLAECDRFSGARLPMLDCTTNTAAQALAERARPGDAVLLKVSHGMKLDDVLSAFRGGGGQKAVNG